MKQQVAQSDFIEAALTYLENTNINWFRPTFDEAKQILSYMSASDWIMFIDRLIRENQIKMQHILDNTNQVYFFFEVLMMIRARRLGKKVGDIVPYHYPKTIDELNKILIKDLDQQLAKIFFGHSRKVQDKFNIDINHHDFSFYLALTKSPEEAEEKNSKRGKYIREDIVIRLVCGAMITIEDLDNMRPEEIKLDRSTKNVTSVSKDVKKLIEKMKLDSFQSFLNLPNTKLTKNLMHTTMITAHRLDKKLPNLQGKYATSYFWPKKKPLAIPNQFEKLNLLRLSNLLVKKGTGLLDRDRAQEILWGIFQVIRALVQEHRSKIEDENIFLETIKNDLMSLLPRQRLEI